jgi:hypothetical protein
MAAPATARFQSPEDALRFYFRTSELISVRPKPGIFSRNTPQQQIYQLNAFGDFLRVDSAFRGMPKLEVSLLQELYAPTFFDTREISMPELCQLMRRKFPKHRFTPRMLSKVKQHALEHVENYLRRDALL